MKKKTPCSFSFSLLNLPVNRDRQVWAGNEDDCREVTWEECNPVEKTVPMSVARMICVDMPVRLADKPFDLLYLFF